MYASEAEAETSWVIPELFFKLTNWSRWNSPDKKPHTPRVGAWICFGGYLLETYSSTQQIVALYTSESEYISTKDVAHALEIRSDLAECDTTLRMKGKNGRDSWAYNGRETQGWPRASLGCAIFVAAAVVGRRRGSLVSAFEPAWRTQRGRPEVEKD